MRTGKLTIDLGRPTAPPDRNQDLRRWWSAITILFALAVFLEVVFAGAMLSGFGWARAAHRLNAVVVIASTFAAGLVAIATLRHIPNGLKLGLTLVSLAVVVFLQAAVGTLSAKGANLLWVHVPLGVALVGFAAQAAAGVRRLGQD